MFEKIDLGRLVEGKVWTLAIVASLILLFGCSETEKALPQDQAAHAIDQSLICPVCPGETIDQSQVPLAHEMRQKVRSLLQEGKSRAEIHQFFVDAYGIAVLASPPKSGRNLTAWIIPPLGIMLGIILVVLSLRGLRRSSISKRKEVPEIDSKLSSYLEQVDSDLETNP